jgi:hypothetical protein
VTERFELPKGLTNADEARHSPPAGAEATLFGDTLWVSVVDPAANVFGVLHWHLTNKGFGRHESYFVLDGVQQSYALRTPLDPKPDAGPWSDGVLTYEVIDPFQHIRITMDGPRYGFELDFTGRFAPFDYHDSVRGDPLAVAFPFHAGHYEQAMDCKGTFELRAGPAKGERRTIDCWSHRDHTWSDRFAQEPDWDFGGGHMLGHFWPSIQLPDRHINVFGFWFQAKMGQPNETASLGGFESTKDGSRPILNAAAELVDTEADGVRTMNGVRYELTMPDGDVIHVRSTKKHGQIKLWLRGENELENRMDCYEPFFDWIVEETGETGTGVGEFSVFPPLPQWLV